MYEELIKRLRWTAANDEQVFDAETATLAADAIEQLQSRLAQITAERHGRWIKKHDNVVYWYACSECGEETPCNKWGHRCFSRFCPSCGSRMDLEVNEYA